MTLVLALGWCLHLASWLAALRRAGRAAATRREWPREVALRLALAGLVVWALALPGEPPGPPALSAVLAGLFVAGQLLASWARAALGPRRWGIGVEPRGGPVSDGPYRLVRHPIYVGTGAALLCQAVLLGNLPAVVLAAGWAVVVPLKIAEETRRLRARARP